MSNEEINPEKDPVIAAVIRLNAGYKNKNYAKQHAVQVGKANIHTVIFEGADGVWRTNYVYERGDQRLAYWDLRTMLADRNTKLFPSYKDPENLKIIFAGVFTALLCIAVIYVAIWAPTNKDSLNVLVPLLTLGIGYFVGSAPGKSKKAKS